LPVDSGKKKIPKNMVSKNVHYDEHCGTYLDCHDCVVSGCDFDYASQKCVRDNGILDTSTASLYRFFNKAVKCSDYLNVCKSTVMQRASPNQDYFTGDYGFISCEKDDLSCEEKVIPDNYFCYWNYTENYRSALWVNET
jgi:hypothetical protein